MQTMIRLAAAGAALALAALSAGPSAAAANSCTISALPVVFGQYDRLTPSDLTATGSVSFTCTQAAVVSVFLTAGRGGSFAPRRMAGPGNSLLFYNLFLDPVGAQIWGDGTGGSQFFTTRSAAGPTTVPVFGRIFAAQGAPKTGSYSDSISISINF
jgi:spore coat protein U-like protein